ncbi:MAG: hypothetical protein JWN29_834, partial [Acidimicrobiales bacterium]|nr:hypothetical protein [Acidimicrobiales bacterium]
QSLTIQTAFPTLTTAGGAGLFVRIFNTGQSCWLDGHPGVSLRTAKGDWTTLRLRPSDAVATNGPPWTGVFDPSLVGVVVFGQQPDANGSAVRYSALRLLLPNGGGSLEHKIGVTFNSPELTVQAFEADSQDR